MEYIKHHTHKVGKIDFEKIVIYPCSHLPSYIPKAIVAKTAHMLNDITDTMERSIRIMLQYLLRVIEDIL